MSLEVRAASIRKNRANSRSPAMRDSVYEVESPCVVSSGVQYCCTLNFDWFMPMPCWPLWTTKQPQSSLKKASKQPQSSLKTQNSYEIRSRPSIDIAGVCKNLIHFCRNFEFWGCPVLWERPQRLSYKPQSQVNLKTQKFIQKMSKITIYLCYIHFTKLIYINKNCFDSQQAFIV